MMIITTISANLSLDLLMTAAHIVQSWSSVLINTYKSISNLFWILGLIGVYILDYGFNNISNTVSLVFLLMKTIFHITHVASLLSSALMKKIHMLEVI